MSSVADAPKTPGVPDFGTPLGRFRLLDKIGSGDVSEVYRATVVGVEGFERRVAIKVMRPDVDEVEVGRIFAEEARVSAMLDHPSVVQVYEFGAIEGVPFVAMEYLRGKNLEQVTAALRSLNERLSPALAVFIAQKVASALGLAHELEDEHGHPLGLVHGDVTPANILLVREGTVKLLDFGVARITRDPSLVTRDGHALPRNFRYVSPEEAQGHPPDKRSDVFSLGVVLWEMLAGRPLFGGPYDRQTLANIVRAEIPPPSRFAPDVPPELDAIVGAALSRDLERRYRSADMLAQDLDEMTRVLPSRHGDLPALLERLWERSREVGTIDSTLAAIPVPAQLRPWSRRLVSPKTILLGAAAASVGFLVAASLVTGGGIAPDRAPTPEPAATVAPAPPSRPALPPPAVLQPAAVPPPCGATDAGPPCEPIAAQPAPEPKRSERARRHRSSSSRGDRDRDPSRKPPLLDRRPNPFGD
jgi:serine/threonine protein kinase